MTVQDQLWSQLNNTLHVLGPGGEVCVIYAQTLVGNVRAWICPSHAVANAGQIVVAIQSSDGQFGFRLGQLVHSLTGEQAKALLDAKWYDHPCWLRAGGCGCSQEVL